jgi:hypothetical protein
LRDRKGGAQLSRTARKGNQRSSKERTKRPFFFCAVFLYIRGNRAPILQFARQFDTMKQILRGGIGTKRLVLLLLCMLMLACTAQTPAAETRPEPTPEPTPTEEPVEIVAVRAETLAPTDTPVPTEAPTPEPTSEPTPEPTPEPERIDAARLDSGEFDSYFDDAVFVGDSITKTFRNYVTAKRESDGGCLGDAKFLGVINMSALRAAKNRINDDGINFISRGSARPFSEAVRATGAKKVFILFGVNELVWCRWDDETKAFERLIELVHSVEPDAEIVIQALLPITKRYCGSLGLEIGTWNSYNDVLREMCERNGVAFLSFAEQLMDSDGYLKEAYSSDRQYHLNGQGNDIWIRALREYAARRMYPDAVVEIQEGD